MNISGLDNLVTSLYQVVLSYKSGDLLTFWVPYCFCGVIFQLIG